jgi:site-specific DNA-methyltransferase (adenine-specific)
MFNYEEMKNKIIHADCMDIMKDIPDKYFELAITDPPYGINADSMTMGRGSGNDTGKFKSSGWDTNVPDENYFQELKRISHNQIIWGGNYYNLGSARCYLLWDKMDYNSDFASAELAWTSFDKVVKTFKHARKGKEKRIHICQKPIALYRWILQHYAKPGDKIIDTHSGSGSLACACHLEKFDFLAIEKDADYYKSSVERLETLRSQGTLF